MIWGCWRSAGPQASVSTDLDAGPARAAAATAWMVLLLAA